MFIRHEIEISAPDGAMQLADVPPGSIVRWRPASGNWQLLLVPCEFVVHSDSPNSRVAIDLRDGNTVVGLDRAELCYPLADGEVVTIKVRNSGREFAIPSRKGSDKI